MAASSQNEPGLGHSDDDKAHPEMEQPSELSCTNIEDKHVNQECLSKDYKKAAELLSSGIKTNYIADIEKAKSRIDELGHNQDVLRESIQQEMTNLEEYRLTDDVKIFIQDLKLYQSKLCNIKKDVQYVTDKVSKMKKKAVKLQIGKQKEELHKAQQKQKELELQKQITAKPASSSFSG